MGNERGVLPVEAKGSPTSPGHIESPLVWFFSVNLPGVFLWPLLHQPRWHSLPGLLIRLAFKSHCTHSPGNALICCTTASPFAINLL